tara:strand:- start:181 stop:363 length:183 start_codon:yes stop_codon:yes gene_type:complete
MVFCIFVSYCNQCLRKFFFFGSNIICYFGPEFSGQFRAMLREKPIAGEEMNIMIFLKKDE